MIRRQFPARPISDDIAAVPDPEVATQDFATEPTFETDDMVLLHGSPDRHRRGQRFRHARGRCHADVTERAVNGCNEAPELIGSDPVVREITANDRDHEATIYLLRGAFVGHIPTKRLIKPNMVETSMFFKFADKEIFRDAASLRTTMMSVRIYADDRVPRTH